MCGRWRLGRGAEAGGGELRGPTRARSGPSGLLPLLSSPRGVRAGWWREMVVLGGEDMRPKIWPALGGTEVGRCRPGAARGVAGLQHCAHVQQLLPVGCFDAENAGALGAVQR